MNLNLLNTVKKGRPSPSIFKVISYENGAFYKNIYKVNKQGTLQRLQQSHLSPQEREISICDKILEK